MDEMGEAQAVEPLWLQTVARLQESKEDSALVRGALLTYLSNGYELGLVAEELIDFFCVSTPNILEEAGFGGSSSDEIMVVFDEIHEQVWRSRRAF